MPRFVPRHNVNMWVRKDFASGFHGAFGVRHLGEQFGNNTNTIVLDAYTLASGAIGYHARQ